HDQTDLALAVVRDRLGNGRALAGLEVFRGGLLERPPRFIGRLAARDFCVRVHVDRDELIELHGRAPFCDCSHCATVKLRSTSSTNSGAGSQCMGPNRSRYFLMPSSSFESPIVSA